MKVLYSSYSYIEQCPPNPANGQTVYVIEQHTENWLQSWGNTILKHSERILRSITTRIRNERMRNAGRDLEKQNTECLSKAIKNSSTNKPDVVLFAENTNKT